MLYYTEKGLNEFLLHRKDNVSFDYNHIILLYPEEKDNACYCFKCDTKFYEQNY